MGITRQSRGIRALVRIRVIVDARCIRVPERMTATTTILTTTTHSYTDRDDHEMHPGEEMARAMARDWQVQDLQ